MSNTNIWRRVRATAPILLLCLGACGGGGSNNGLSSSPQASTYDGAVHTTWFDTFYTLVKTANLNPPVAARVYSIATIAGYEALVPGMSDRRSLQGQLNEFPVGTIPAPENARYHWPTVANRTLAVVAGSFFAPQQATIDSVESDFLTAFELEQAEAVITRSVQYGEDVANAILLWIATDGFADQTACGAAFTVPVTPENGGWEPIAPATGLGLLPCWGDMRTYVVTDSDECAPIEPPLYSEDPSSAWYAQALVVYNTTGDNGANLTPDQTAIARYWADGPMTTGTPAGHWIALCGQLCGEAGMTLDDAAEAFARVGIAVGDSFPTCWRAKYLTYLKRPQTYITELIDVDWNSLLTTPNFPSYSSGHSTQSGAAAVQMTRIFGPLTFVDTTHSRLDASLGFIDRSFTSFYQAGAEAALSRMYGGIHYAFDNTNGFDSGLCVGAIIDAHLQFEAD